MKLFLLLSLITTSSLASTYQAFVDSDRLKISRTDQVIAEHLVNITKLVEKGYIGQDVLSKTIREVEKSNHFAIFLPWLKSIEIITKLNKTEDLITNCAQYIEKKETLPLEKVLERLTGNFCREKTLENIGRGLSLNKELTPAASLFIQGNLKYFLTKKNKKDFAFFLQSQASNPEILKKISQEITTYSVSHEIVPSHEVLKDIEINEQITKLIQDKGFNPLQHQNVFYAEYGKLIELGYRALEKEPVEAKTKEHFLFLKNYLDLNQDHLPVGLCLSRLNDFAKSIFRNGFKDLSRDVFKYIIKMNNKEILEDAQFFYLWTYLNENDFKETLKIADKYNLLKKDAVIMDPRLKFWIAHSLENTNKKDDAIRHYEAIVKNNPLSFYAIMSVKKLHALKPDSLVTTFYPSNSLPVIDIMVFSPTDLSEDYTSSLIRLRTWAKIDNAKMMNLEIKRISLHSMPEFLVKFPTDKQIALRSDLNLINAKLIQESKNYLATFRYLYEVLDKKEVTFNRSLLEILYPKPFLEDLVKLLKNDNLDPIVVLSLIRQESVFNPLARSPVGARGLMQLMPMTARRLRHSVRDQHLTNPKINIELGTKYFKGLLKRYDGNLVYVLSAYNAGESRVERWKNLYFDVDESILKNIEAIPFLETRNYVKLIFRNIFFYKLLLEKKEELADTGEPNKIYDVNLGFKR